MNKNWTPGPWEVLFKSSRPTVEAMNKERCMRAAGDKYPQICTMVDGSMIALDALENTIPFTHHKYLL